jgi:hypothetical protein
MVVGGAQAVPGLVGEHSNKLGTTWDSLQKLDGLGRELAMAHVPEPEGCIYSDRERDQRVSFEAG